jgi:2-haloacid dehalogenase
MNLTKPISYAIVFDFGRVLVDWDPRYLYRKLLDDPQDIERFLQEAHFYDMVRQQDAGRPVAETITEWCQRYPAYCDLIRAYDVRYPESISGPIWGTVEILRALKRAGYPVYGLSNWPGEKFRLMRPSFEFFDWLDGMVISGEVGLAKPDPRIYHLLLERAGRPAPECIFIDDSQTNIAAARQLGFRTIHFASPEQLRWELEIILGSRWLAQCR